MSSRFTSSEDQILSAISKAEDQMYKSGIVAVGDICNSGITLSLKKRSSLTFYNFIEVSGWLPKVAEIRFAQGQALLDQFTDLLTAPCQSSICPHAPYSVSEGLWERITPLFAQATSVTMHSQETSGENEWFLRGTGDLARLYQLMGLDYSFFAPSGRSSLQTCLRRFQTARRLILVHNTFISEDDLRYLASHRPQEDATFLCLCVNANEYITGKVPPVPLMRASEFRIVLGTDSLASNHTLDLLAEIKTVLRHFPLIPQTEILKWATINGAMALALDNQFGSFEAGKCPGVALLDQILDGRLTQATTARRIL